MKLSKTLWKALNEQINAEFYSAYLYQSMASWLTSRELPGMAGWMALQAKEEMEHGMKIYHYIEERGEQPLLGAIDGPPNEWKSVKEVFCDAQNHERHVSELIASLIDLAREEKDYAAEVFLAWFIEEQVEEEANAARNLHVVSLADEAAGKLHLLDHEFRRRGD